MMRMARSCGHVRRLQGLLRKLRTLTDVRGHVPTEQELDDLLHDTGARRRDHRDVMEAVARRYGLHADELTGDGRRPQQTLARQIAMYVCRRSLGLSYPEIGRAFGGRDHSTVIHAVKKIEKILVNDKNVRDLVASVTTSASK